MEKADEKQVKTWIEYGIREEIRNLEIPSEERIKLLIYSEESKERIKYWIQHEIKKERRRIEDERNESKLQALKYGFVIVMTSSVWLFICMIIKTHAAS